MTAQGEVSYLPGWSFLAQVVSLGAGRGAGKILNFVGFTLIVRALGPQANGAFAFALSVASLMAFLPNMGVDPYYAREVASGRECQSGLLKLLLRLKLWGAAVFLILYPAITWFSTKQPPPWPTILFVALAFAALCFSQTWQTVLVTAERAEWAGFIDFAQSVVFLLLVVFVVGNRPTTDNAAAVFAAAQISGAVIGALLVTKLLAAGPNGSSSTATYSSLFQSTLPLMMIWLFSDLYLRVDTAMLFVMRGDLDTGYYAAAYRLVDGLCAATLVLCAVVLPRMSRGLGRSTSDWAREWRHGVTVLCCAIALPALSFWLWPDQLISYIYGPAFLKSAASLKILGPAAAVLCFGYLQGNALTSAGLERQQLTITGIGLLTNVALNLSLIPRFAGVGAAWATLLSALVYVAFAQYRLRRFEPVSMASVTLS